ncbi:unnamed protein product [Lymnaea stagnalis]|uniref:Endonuclease/exonuclease/phosphatase domain-containing protein n=1 Tax=Lymnaea stagnalis TaxID=6523 RepID=A0AAV2I7I3_LYMST
MKAIKRTLKGEKDIIIVGDFNLAADANAFDDMCAEGYKPCISAETFTNISNKNPAGSKNYDNIWINADTRVFTGVSGVVREGLTSLWIPNGWSWGGVVSDHCPVYAQLYCDVDLDSEDVTAKDVKFTLTHG